jgi:hypothetical protein
VSRFCNAGRVSTEKDAGLSSGLTERVGDRDGALRSVRPILFKHSIQQLDNLGGHAFHILIDGHRNLMEMLFDQSGFVIGREWAPSSQHSIQQNPHGVDVGARIDNLALNLFRRGVGIRSHKVARCGGKTWHNGGAKVDQTPCSWRKARASAR